MPDDPADNGKVETSYNTGSVSGSGNVSGGVVGCNNGGTVETSYNTGNVSGGGYVGGVVGCNNGGTVETSYYLSTSSTSAEGGGTTCTRCSSFTNSTSNSSATFSNLGSFTGWNAATGTFSTPSATWYIGPGVTVVYGITAPVLVSDMPVDTVTGSSGTSVYNGQTVATSYTQSVTMGGGSLVSGISTATAGPNAGTYTVTPTVTTLPAPATQTNVESVSVVSGIWTIAPKTLSFTGIDLSNPTMTYDGGTSVALTTSNSSATLSGFVSGQGATYTGATGTFSSSSAGTHPVTATLTTADFSGSGSGFSWSNYSLSALTLSGPGTILPANLSPSGSGSSGTGRGSGGSGGGFSNLVVPPPFENIVENMNQNSSPTPLAASSVFGGNLTSSGGNGGTGDGILDVSDLPR